MTARDRCFFFLQICKRSAAKLQIAGSRAKPFKKRMVAAAKGGGGATQREAPNGRAQFSYKSSSSAATSVK
ncbi:MAG: hypothetical protein NWQ37_14210, partial [Marivita lacus]|nr:hypothetical protein [Marivita lacus]